MQVNDKPWVGQLADVDLRLLRVFQAVADCGGMASAELELNLAMSTISRHVKDLETRLGLVLCRRGRAGFALTPEGEQVYAATRQLLAATEVFRSSLHDVHRRLGGDLHLALFEKTATNPQSRIAQALARFRALAPQVNLHLHVGPIGMIERGVLDGQFQLGIVPEHRRSDSLVYDDLFGETMQLYAGRRAPLVRSADRRPGLGRAAPPATGRPGLPLAQHGADAPAPARAGRHRLRPGGRGHAHPLGRLRGFPARPLCPRVRGARADAGGGSPGCAASAPSTAPHRRPLRVTELLRQALREAHAGHQAAVGG
jgi:DNA-binding transcriptional LysR family regulator